MSKKCFNCKRDIEKPEEGICSHCGIRFELNYVWNDDLQNACDIAVDLKRKGRFDEAKRMYKKMNVDYPNNPVVYKAWAKTMMVSGDYDFALEYFIKAKSLYEFFDDPIGNQSLEDCKQFIRILTSEERGSQSYLNILKAMSGNLNYTINLKWTALSRQ